MVCFPADFLLLYSRLRNSPPHLEMNTFLQRAGYLLELAEDYGMSKGSPARNSDEHREGCGQATKVAAQAP